MATDVFTFHTLLRSSVDVTSESFCFATNDKNWYLARMKSALVGLQENA